MKYTLTRIDPNEPIERYPAEKKQTVDDPLQDVGRGILLGKLENVMHCYHEHNIGMYLG